jgi:phosphoglycerate dehydrogenase-like enzyme
MACMGNPDLNALIAGIYMSPETWSGHSSHHHLTPQLHHLQPQSTFLITKAFTTMSAYKNFAIWGAGNLGGRIATRLLERNASVIILSRPVGSTSLTMHACTENTPSRR